MTKVLEYNENETYILPIVSLLLSELAGLYFSGSRVLTIACCGSGVDTINKSRVMLRKSCLLDATESLALERGVNETGL